MSLLALLNRIHASTDRKRQPLRLRLDNLESREQPGSVADGLLLGLFGGAMLDPWQAMASAVGEEGLLAAQPLPEFPDAPSTKRDDPLPDRKPFSSEAPAMKPDTRTAAPTDFEPVPFRLSASSADFPELDLSRYTVPVTKLAETTPATGSAPQTPIRSTAAEPASSPLVTPPWADGSANDVVPAPTADPAELRGRGPSGPQATDPLATPIVTLERVKPVNPDAAGVGGFRIWRDGTAGDLTVNYTVTGTATAGEDYAPLSGTIVIADGNRVAAIQLDPLRFDYATGRKAVRLTLDDSADYDLGETITRCVRLGRFEQVPVVTVETSRPLATDEGDAFPGEFTFRRTTTAGDLTVDYAVSGTAAPGVDYLSLTGQVVIPAGMDWVSVRVRPENEPDAEQSESVTLEVLPSIRYDVGGQALATVTIEGDPVERPTPQNNPPPPTTSMVRVPWVSPCDCGCSSSTPQPDLRGLHNVADGIQGSLTDYFFSRNPVQYGAGQVRLGGIDLESSGFGIPWGQSRTWSNLDGHDQGSNLGKGWSTEQSPHLRIDMMTGDVTVVFNANIAKYFDSGMSGYSEIFGGPETLVHNSTTKRFTYVDSTGAVFLFYDNDLSHPYLQAGGLVSITTADGAVTSVTSRDTDGRITEVQRSETVGGVTTIESFLTAHLTSAPNAGRQSSVTLRRKVGSGSWSTVRTVEYTYYNGTDGPVGNLKRAVVKDAGANVLNTDYFRYYAASAPNGYENGLKFFVGGAQYARMEADLGGSSSVDSAADSAIDDYANNYFEYQSDHRVTKEIASGAGCSACSAGQGTYTFAYTQNTLGLAGVNSWATKTVETLPDGNQNIVYTNVAGGMMLKAFKDTVTNDIWATYYRYDSLGREIFRAEPSAVIGWSDSYDDLMNVTLGVSSYLRDSAGLVSTKVFGSSTTATTSTPGDVVGYFKESGIQRGELGTNVPQSAATYIKHSNGGVDVYPLAEETVYRNSNGTGGQTTSHAYTWLSGTNQVEQLTVTRPAATTAQNGSNAADADEVVFDAFGRPRWVKDAAGFLHYTEYDFKTGAVVKTITDVDSSQTSTFAGLPSGWSTPSGGGLHLTASYEVDNVGRVTKATDPNGNVTYIVYDDDAHETRIYPGWNTGSNTTTGPTIVMREDWARGYRETLTMSATPNAPSGFPTGAESIGSVLTLSREVMNEAGQVLYRDEYFDLAGVTYSQSTATLGTLGTNYNRTTFGYDKQGRHAKTVTPAGTIYRDEFDGQGRLLSQWVGTYDTPTTGFWSVTNTAGTDMVKVWEGEYDGGGIGDGNLTKETSFPGGGAADRVTAHSYDWRNRPVAMKEGVESSEGTGVNRPIGYLEYDNLNLVVAIEQYDGDTLSITTDSNTDGVPDRPSSSALRAKTTIDYDEQKRAYRESTFSVDPSSGSVSTNSLRMDRWFDGRGLEIKTLSPGGMAAKNVFDGDGRIKTAYTTDAGGDTGYTNADDVTGDAVLLQVEYTYDANGNINVVVDRQRYHDETGTGALGSLSTGNKARVSFKGYY